ncbi:palmitoyltransferase akr1 [Serendipita sp. 399]|nr:palmitoyltransferase akr1 [Serendipita sp. 399]
MASGIGTVASKGETTAAISTEGDMQAEFASHGQQTVQEPEDNIFSASQRGDLDLVRRLIESGEATVNDRDPQNISPLHWAAINANLPVCRYLLEQGAEVDVVGGELMATPLQWAARNGHLYILHLLLSHNADPTLKDSQGYDSLQLATHSSSVMSLLYMLQQPGHTPLMWAAYQGDAISVEILLKHNADPMLQDEKGMTALHWGVVKANRAVIRRLVEAAPTLLQSRDETGKTPRELAQSLKSFSPFKRALEEGGMDEMGLPLKRPVLSERNTRLAILILPTLCLGAIFKTFEILPWWTALPLAGAEFLGMHHVISRVLLGVKINGGDGGVTNSPYCAGIIIGTMVWLGWCWFTRIVYNTPGYATANLAFIILFILCAYNFFRAVTLDAGVCPPPAGEEEKKLVRYPPIHNAPLL